MVHSAMIVSVAALFLVAPLTGAEPLEDVTVSAALLTTGEVQTWTFGFTTATEVPQNGSVRIVFPESFVLSTGSTTTCRFTGEENVSAVTTDERSSTELACLLGPNDSIANGTAVRLELDHVANPRTARETGNFTIQTTDANSTMLDDYSGSAVTISAHAFSSGPGQSNPDHRASAITAHRFSFAPFNPWPADGKLMIRFPDGYSFNGQGAGSTQASFKSGASGDFAAPEIEGQVLILSRSSGQAVQRGQGVEIEVTAIRNPSQAGTTGPFAVSTTDASRASMDFGEAPGVDITANPPPQPPPDDPEPTQDPTPTEEPSPTPTEEPTPTPTEEPTPTPTEEPTPSPTDDEEPGEPFGFDGNGSSGSRDWNVSGPTDGTAPSLAVVAVIAGVVVTAFAVARRSRR